MTESLQTELAKRQFENLERKRVLYTYSQILAIMSVAEMNDTDLKGAIKKVVKPLKGYKKNADVYTPKDMIKIFLAHKLAQEERERIEKRGKNERFMWENVKINSIPGMIINNKEELWFADPVGQKVIAAMVNNGMTVRET